MERQMAGYHAVAARGTIDPATLIRAVYGLDDAAPVRPNGAGELPWNAGQGTAGVAHVLGWTVAVGGFPADMLDDDELSRLARVSMPGELIRWATEDASGTVGLDRFVNGAHVRGFLSVEGDIAASAGEPLDGEPEGGLEQTESWDRDEWLIVSVVERYAVPWDEIAQAEFQLFQFAG
jgi:hypothetical protein